MFLFFPGSQLQDCFFLQEGIQYWYMYIGHDRVDGRTPDPVEICFTSL